MSPLPIWVAKWWPIAFSPKPAAEAQPKAGKQKADEKAQKKPASKPKTEK